MGDDGVFWAAKWEVKVNRMEKVPKKSTDQWIQRTGSVRLKALWLCGKRHEDMEDGYEFSDVWNPMFEANPKDFGPEPSNVSRTNCNRIIHSEGRKTELSSAYFVGK